MPESAIPASWQSHHHPAPSVLKPRILESSITTGLTAPETRASSFSSSMSGICPLVRHGNVGGKPLSLRSLQAPSAARQFVGIHIQADVDESRSYERRTR